MLEIRDNINQVLAASRNFLEKSLKEKKENSSYPEEPGTHQPGHE